MELNEDLALRLMRKMLLIRRFEETAHELFSSGKGHGIIHVYAGEEAVAVGVCENLRKEDYITSTHRGHGHCIAKGASIKTMFAELMGKKTGACKGKGGSMHVADFDYGILGANGIVGAGMPLACGAALTAKTTRKNLVAVSFFGDGAAAQGTLHESLNLSALWKLPVIFVCEDNMFAQYVPSRRSSFSRYGSTN